MAVSSTGSPGDGHPVPTAVELDRADDQGPLGVLDRRTGPPQHRLDPGHDLARAERLGDVVVAAQLQAEHPVDLVVAGGAEQDRHPVALGAQRAAHLGAVHPGQPDVEDQGDRAAAGGRPPGRRARCRPTCTPKPSRRRYMPSRSAMGRSSSATSTRPRDLSAHGRPILPSGSEFGPAVGSRSASRDRLSRCRRLGVVASIPSITFQATMPATRISDADPEDDRLGDHDPERAHGEGDHDDRSAPVQFAGVLPVVVVLDVLGDSGRWPCWTHVARRSRRGAPRAAVSAAPLWHQRRGPAGAAPRPS